MLKVIFQISLPFSLLHREVWRNLTKPEAQLYLPRYFLWFQWHYSHRWKLQIRWGFIQIFLCIQTTLGHELGLPQQQDWMTSHEFKNNFLKMRKFWILVISLLVFFSYFGNNRTKSDKHAHRATQTWKETKCHPKANGKIPSNIINARISSCMLFCN